jgi:nodulation protein F
MWDAKFEEILRSRLPFLGPDEEIVEDLVLRDLGLDSMAVVDLLVALEEAYATRFPPEALTLQSFSTPGTLWKVLTEATAASA